MVSPDRTGFVVNDEAPQQFESSDRLKRAVDVLIPTNSSVEFQRYCPIRDHTLHFVTVNRDDPEYDVAFRYYLYRTTDPAPEFLSLVRDLQRLDPPLQCVTEKNRSFPVLSLLTHVRGLVTAASH